MRVRLILAAILTTCFFTVAANGQLPNWKSIVPLQTTAKDVKKLWGEPQKSGPDIYYFKGFNLMVTYASGLNCESKCIELGRASGWSVPRDIVVTAVFMIKDSMHLSDLGINLNSFKRERASDYGNGIYLSSDEQGIGITLEGDEITNISLFPAKKDFHLMCKGGNEKPICPTK